MNIKQYYKVADVPEAYELLQKAKSNCIIGGGTFLQRTHRNINIAIDLEKCNLDYIVEEEDCVRIGSMTSLRELEVSEIMKRNFGLALNECLEHLIGVQLRNMITIGGHISSRFGFSDILTLFLTMNVTLQWFHHGEISLKEYAADGIGKERDVLTELRIPKNGTRYRVSMMRKSYNDYSILCTAAAKSPTGKWTFACGARPMRAVLAENAMKEINQGKITEKDIPLFAEQITEEFIFGTNYRGSAEYRKTLSTVFFRKMIEDLWNED